MSTDEQSVVNEEIWRIWVQQDKQRERATARKLKILAVIVVALVVIGLTVHFLR